MWYLCKYYTYLREIVCIFNAKRNISTFRLTADVLNFESHGRGVIQQNMVKASRLKDKFYFQHQLFIIMMHRHCGFIAADVALVDEEDILRVIILEGQQGHLFFYRSVAFKSHKKTFFARFASAIQ